MAVVFKEKMCHWMCCLYEATYLHYLSFLLAHQNIQLRLHLASIARGYYCTWITSYASYALTN